jgi:hypothetical protein
VELNWTGGETELRWPWLVVVLSLLVVGLLLAWARSWWRRTPRGA